MTTPRVTKRWALWCVTIFAVNVLTWTFIGRGSSLRLAAQFFEASGRSAEGDTLHVVGSYAQYRGGRTPLYFSRAERERFLRDLKAAGGVRTVVYHDSVANVFFGRWIVL